MARSSARVLFLIPCWASWMLSWIGPLPGVAPAGAPLQEGAKVRAGADITDPLDKVRPFVGDARRHLERNARTFARSSLKEAVKRLQKLGREGVAPGARLQLLGEMDGLATRLEMLDERLLLCQEVADEYERTRAPEDADRLRARTRLAEALSDKDDPARARVILEETRVLQEEHLGREHGDTLATRHLLALVLSRLGELDGARVHLEAVLVVRLRVPGNEHEDTLRTKQDLARVRAALGDPEGARVLLEDVVAAREGALGSQDPAVLQAKGELAAAREETGDLVGTEKLLQELIQTQKSLRKQDESELATLSEQLERIAHRRQFLDALRGAAASLAPSPSAVSSPVAVVPRDWRHELRRRAALESFRHLTARKWGVPSGLPQTIDRKLRGAAVVGSIGSASALLPSVPGIPVPGLSLPGLGTRKEPAAKPPPIDPNAVLESDTALGDLMQAFEAHLGAGPTGALVDPAEQQWFRLGSAGQSFEVGRPAQAALELDELLATDTSRIPSDDADLIEAKRSLAFVKRDLGELERARILLEEVAAAEERMLPSDHPALHETRAELAWTYCELDRRAGAQEWRAELQLTLDRILRGMRERTRLLWACSAREAQEAARAEFVRLAGVLSLLDALGLHGGLEREAFEALETLRSVSVLQPATARALSAVPELVEKGRARAQASAELQDLCLAGPQEHESSAAFGRRILALAERRDALDEEIQGALAQRGCFVRSLRAEELAKALPEATASVSFLRYERELPRAADGTRAAPESVFVAFVLRRASPLARFDLGPAAELERLVLGWRDQLGRPLLARGESVRLPAVSAGEDFAGSIRTRLEPVLAALGETRALHLCLDDILHLLPVEALSLADGSLLGQRFAVRHEPALARLLAPAAKSSTEPTAVLAGGIDYDAQTSLEGGEGAAAVTPPVETRAGRGRLQALPGTEEEVRVLAEVFQQAFERPAQVLRGPQANKGSLREALARARFVHLATHGWFAADEVPSRADGLAERLGAPALVLGFAPRVLCGLALAGANRGLDELGRARGILTAEELSGYELTECELAVLSACETNVGLRRAGQGVQSLQAALHAAGARTAITSLWKVDDLATRQLMEHFYRALWSEHRSPAEALWSAKMALRAEGKGPADWAAWILTGAAD